MTQEEGGHLQTPEPTTMTISGSTAQRALDAAIYQGVNMPVEVIRNNKGRVVLKLHY